MSFGVDSGWGWCGVRRNDDDDNAAEERGTQRETAGRSLLLRSCVVGVHSIGLVW